MILETKGMSKRFGQQYALKNVNLEDPAWGDSRPDRGKRRREVHLNQDSHRCLLTGRRTGVVEGQAVELPNPHASRRLGINVIHQNRHLVPQFNAIENVYLGLDYEKKAKVAIDWKKMRSEVEKIMEELSIEVPLNVPAMYLTPPQKTLVEIIRGMMTDCKLLSSMSPPLR